MRHYGEVNRLIYRYNKAFSNGREELYSQREVHIGVLEIAIAVVDEQLSDLLDELGLWGEAIAYNYEAKKSLNKWMLIHRFIMFLLTKYAEHKYQRALDDFNYLRECKKEMEGFMKQFVFMRAW